MSSSINYIMRSLTLNALLILFIALAASPVSAQTPRARMLEPARIKETALGTLVTIIANETINDYTAQQFDNRFQVVIPRAGISVVNENVYNGRLVNIR